MRLITFTAAIGLIEFANVATFNTKDDSGYARITPDEDGVLMIEEDIEYPARTYFVNQEQNPQVTLRKNELIFAMENEEVITVSLFTPFDMLDN